MKKSNLLLIFTLIICFRSICNAQEIEKKEQDSNIIATYVVLPKYTRLALATRSQGETIIEIEISADGNVVNTETISGNKLLAGISHYVLKKWKFNRIEEEKKTRKTKISFTYHLIPKSDEFTDELFPIFQLPFRIEITEIMPEESPSFSKKKSKR